MWTKRYDPCGLLGVLDLRSDAPSDAVTAIEKADIGALGNLLAKLPADVLATIAKSLDAPSCSASKMPIAVEDELLLLGARDLLAELDSQQIKEWLPGM